MASRQASPGSNIAFGFANNLIRLSLGLSLQRASCGGGALAAKLRLKERTILSSLIAPTMSGIHSFGHSRYHRMIIDQKIMRACSSHSMLSSSTKTFAHSLRQFQSSVVIINQTAKVPDPANLARLLNDAQAVLRHAVSIHDAYVEIRTACSESEEKTRQKIRPHGVSLEKTLAVWPSVSYPWRLISATLWPHYREQLSEYHDHLDTIRSDLPAMERASDDLARLIKEVQGFIECLNAVLGRQALAGE
ncbi:MAG: hypothetical protein Q9169_006619 [Polycauliona sp. 2 TL-2023]